MKTWSRRWVLNYGWFMIGWVFIITIVNAIFIISGQYNYAEPDQAIPFAIGGICGGLIGGLVYPILLIIFMQTQKVKDAFPDNTISRDNKDNLGNYNG